MVDEGAHGRNGSGLLATAKGTRRDEDTNVFTPEATGGPDTARFVPEGLPLRREVSVAGGNTHEDGVVLEEGVGFSDGVVRLGRSVHLREDFVREGFSDPE